MIGSVDWFGEIFGSFPEGEIKEWNKRAALQMIRAGLAVVIIKPNDKRPACVLNARDAKKANELAQDAAKERGNPGWDKVIHPCGVTHAITEESHLTRVQTKKLLEAGANLAIGVGKGSLRVAVLDLDTTAQVQTFRELCESHGDVTTFAGGMTVASPGVLKVSDDGEEKWVHKDGGHLWMLVPDGMELPENKGKLSWCPCHQYRVTIDDPKNPGVRKACDHALALYWGSGYILVPPSVRPEGAYRLVGTAVEMPTWLADMAEESIPERLTNGSDGFLGSFEDDPIDTWAANTSWAEILTQDGFTPAGVDSCGCPTYTRPGDSSHMKSVTGHEVECSYHDGSGGQNPIHIWSDSILSGEGSMSKLTWVAEWRFDGDVNVAMESLGLERLAGNEMDIFAPFMKETREAPKERNPETSPSTSSTTSNIEEEESELSDEEFFTLKNAATDDTGTSEVEEIEFEQSPKFLGDVRKEALKILIRTRAQELMNAYESSKNWSPPTDDDDLSALLLLPAVEQPYAIEDILPVNGNAMLSAEFKSGKTHFILEVCRALADGEPFLGRFKVHTTGKVALWNYELDKDMMIGWLRDTRMKNPGNIRLLNLRGSRVPLETKAGQDWAVEWLKSRQIRTWILDPAVKAMIGWGDENVNTDVTRFTDMLDEIKERAGVSELVIAHHTGRAEMEAGKERARGATRWDDWPDSRWILTREHTSDVRFIRFDGRGNNYPERALSYDKELRRVSLLDSGDPFSNVDKKTFETTALAMKVLDHIKLFPGINQNKIQQDLGIDSVRKIQKVIADMERDKLLYRIDGPNRSKLHYPGERSDELEAAPELPAIEP